MPSECGKNVRSMTSIRRAAADRPRRADEVAEAVDRADGRVVERRDEERAREMRRMVLDPVNLRSRRVGRETERLGERLRNRADLPVVVRAVPEQTAGRQHRGCEPGLAPRCARGLRETATWSMSRPVMPAIARHARIASRGNPATCLIRRKRSSSTAATSTPSRSRTADTSPWYALMPRMNIAVPTTAVARRRPAPRRRRARPAPGRQLWPIGGRPGSHRG